MKAHKRNGDEQVEAQAETKVRGNRGRTARLSAALLAALVAATLAVAAGAPGNAYADEKALTVNASASEEIGSVYQSIQDAINYVDGQVDKAGWTITVDSGEYARFTVLNGLDNLTVQAADGAQVVVGVTNGSDAPAAASGSYPDTSGVSIRQANGVTIKGLTFSMGTQNSPWTSAAISNYAESEVKGDNFSVVDCVFEGANSNIGVFVNTGTRQFNVTGCSFDGMKEAISMYGDNTLMGSANVTGNVFSNCSFAMHGYYGGTGNAGILTFANNTVAGATDTYCKIVIQDQTNTGAIKADIRGNALSSAIVGLVNLREEGETVSNVLTANNFGVNSFYVEAIEPGTIDFYTAYQAPNPTPGKGVWKLTGKEDFDVDWGKNPDGSTAKIQDIIAKANATDSKTLSIAGIDEDNLIKTFTWFKDGIYWGSEAETPVDTLPLSLTKVWNDENDEDGLRPDSVEIEVYKSIDGGEEVLAGTYVIDKTMVDESGNWSATLALPRYELGSAVTYSVKEKAIEGYTSKIETSQAADDNMSCVITNSHTPAPADPQDPAEPQAPAESTETPVKSTPLAQTGDPLSAALPFVACALTACAGVGAFALRRMNSR